MTSCKAVLSLAVLLVASASSAFAQGTYTQIDYPGAVNTIITGIDSVGDLVGTFEDSSGNFHGFLLSAGIYTTIDVAGATKGTYAQGVNDLGQIVGYSNDVVQGGDFVFKGFLYDVQSQTFASVSCPAKHSLGPAPWAINNLGIITGTVYLKRPNGNTIFGFELKGSKCHKVLPPNNPSASLSGINNLGVAVGTGFTTTAFTAFSLKGQRFRDLKIGNFQVSLIGINDAESMVGAYGTTNLQNTGFLHQNGTLQLLAFPGATGTIPSAINNSGEVAGYFFDQASATHGFTWTPPAAAGKK